MITQAKDFLNNIHEELQNFITNQQGEKDDFSDSWYALDYDDVETTIDMMNDDKLDTKPIVHVVELNSPTGFKTESSNVGEVQKINFNSAIYIIVTDNYEDNKKRKILLNKLSSDLKYKFDNYNEEIPHFRNTRMGLPDGILTRDSDGIYSCRLNFYAEIYKKVR